MKKKILAVLLSVVLAGAMLMGCSGKTNETTPEDPSKSVSAETDKTAGNNPIIIGTQPTTMGTPLDYAMKQGWFEEAGINIERILFPTGAPINEAMAANELDIALNGLATVYAVAAGNATWIGEINTAGGLGVYVRPDNPIVSEKGNIADEPDVYGSAETMKGLTVLGPLGTSSQFNVITWMGMFGLTESDYSMLSMDHGPAAQAFISGEGDAIASSPPFTYEIESSGAIKVASLDDTSGITLTDGVCVRRDFLADRRDDVVAVMEIIYRAQEELAGSDELFFDACMEYFNENGREYDEEQMRREIEERDFIGKDFMTQPDYKFGATLFGMGQFYVDDGKIPAEDFPNIADGIDPSILEEIYGIEIPVYKAD